VVVAKAILVGRVDAAFVHREEGEKKVERWEAPG
jgi:hypothetical protein